jgi:hypothetical protein
VQQAIIDHIPSTIQLDSVYFDILQKNVVGAGLCHRKKGGLKATEVLSRKVLEAVELHATAIYLDHLGHNIHSNNELKYLNGIRMH